MSESAPEGYRLEWVEEEPEFWRLATADERETRKCRMIRCPNSPVAALNRGYWKHTESWWLYCGDHLYGRRIRNGRIEVRRLVEANEAPA
jgi:hypothetical protein